ncbi:MAG: hypothetical protein KF819_40445 [Labilithrix sp.]|nr:hypothetical protein [Labilithrix sp.]
MGLAGWKTGGPSPFLTERARARAPRILSYAAAPGAAMLVSPAGDVALFSGAALELDLARVARAASALGATRELASFHVGDACAHVATVCHGWTLCVVSTAGVHPSFVIERLRRASAVFAMALLDGSAGGSGSHGDTGGGGAPAEALAFPPRSPSRARSRSIARREHS